MEQVVVANGDLTFYVRREHLKAVAAQLRDNPALSFEMCLGVCGVHYPAEAGEELHAVYQLLSITHNRRLRVEVTAPDADRTCRRWSTCIPRATSTSVRPGTSSASSSTVIRR